MKILTAAILIIIMQTLSFGQADVSPKMHPLDSQVMRIMEKHGAVDPYFVTESEDSPEINPITGLPFNSYPTSTSTVEINPITGEPFEYSMPFQGDRNVIIKTEHQTTARPSFEEFAGYGLGAILVLAFLYFIYKIVKSAI